MENCRSARHEVIGVVGVERGEAKFTETGFVTELCWELEAEEWGASTTGRWSCCDEPHPPTHREKRSSLLWIIGIASGEQIMWNSAGREMCINTVLRARSPSFADDSPYMTIEKEIGSRGCWVVHDVCAYGPLWAL